MASYTEWDRLVGLFRKNSPNIAKAFDEAKKHSIRQDNELTALAAAVSANDQEGLTWLQPYPSTSLWRQPIGANPAIDANNTNRMNEWMASSVTPYARALVTRDYGVPVVVANASTPRYTLLSSTGYTDTMHALGTVPIPLGALHDPATDQHLAVWDETTENEYAMFFAEWDGVNWTRYAGQAHNTRTSNGIAPLNTVASTAANFSLLAGLIRPEEIAAGHINHALMFAMANASTGFVSPATHGTGASFNALRLQAGNKLQLNPSVNVAGLAIPAWEKTIATALQTYGMYVRDGSAGALAIYAENPLNRTGPDPWVALGFSATESPLFSSAFPWSSMRILVPS